MANPEYEQTIGQWDNLNYVFYPSFQPNGDVKWSGEVHYVHVTLIHVTQCESKQELKQKIVERLKELSLSLSQLANKWG
jgi:hypothetical protein